MATGWKRDYLRYKDFFLNVIVAYNTKPNFKIYLELTLSLATIILFSIFAIRPTLITIIELDKEIKAKEEIQAKLKQKVKNLQIANSILQTDASNLEHLTEAVPITPNPDSLIKQIENLANSYSVQVIGLTISDVILVGNKKAEENKGQLPFTLSAKGNYQDLIAFIKSLENLRRPIKIESMSINSTITENGKVLVMIIDGTTPFLGE